MPITLNGTTGEIPATWTTATRPASPTAGQIGYNTTTAALDVYNGTAWTTALPATSGLATLSNLALNGSTSGTTTLSPSATASGTVTLPAGTGTVAVNGLSTNLVLATNQASTSGTSIDFISIPSWVKRITVMFNGVSLSAGADVLVQLGTGAGPTYTTSGYVSASGRYSYTSSTGGGNSTAGLNIASGNATANLLGSMTIHNITGNTWVGSHVLGASAASNVLNGGGSIALAALLTAVRITSSSTDTFDAGSINIMYE